MTGRTLLLLAIGILFAGFGAYVGVKHYEPAESASSVTSAFFASSFPDAQGTPVPMQQYQGKPVLVNFWATWCPPCVDEMPELNELQHELGAEKLQIVGIGIDSASNIAEFAKKHNITYPLLVAGSSGTDLSRQFGNQAGGLPFTVLLDAQGQVRKQYLGRLKLEIVRDDLRAL